MTGAIIASVTSIIAVTCGAGNVLSLAAIKLGAGELFLGVFNFLSITPFILALCTMSAIEKIGKIKVLTLWYWVSAILLMPILILPWAANIWPAWGCLLLLAATNAFRNGAIALGSTGWFPLLQDIVPSRYTGRFFARLRTSWQTASLIALITAAFVLGKDPSWIRFEILFVIAVIAEAAKAWPVHYMVEKPLPQDPPPMTIRDRVAEYYADPAMRHYSLYILFYIVASTAMEPFKIKLLNDLGYGYGFILASTAMVGFGAVVSLRFWGSIADKFGNRSIFGMTHIGMMLATAGWIFVWPNSKLGMIYVMTLYFLWSAFNCGNTLAQTNYMLRAVSTEKQNFLTFILLIQRMATAVAPLLAGLVLDLAGRFKIRFWTISSITMYDILFAASVMLFLLPHTMRRKLKAPTDTPTSQVINHITKPMLMSMAYLTRPIRSRLWE